jgi:hypothetical protein
MISKFLFTSKYWELYKVQVLTMDFVFDVCKWLGFFWLIIEPLSYFSQEINNFIHLAGFYFLLLPIVFTLIQRKPKTKFKYHVFGKDVIVSIEIGDLFKQKGKDIVIPTNIHFITEVGRNLISQNSIQGQFVKKYYSSNSSHLDSDIEKSIEKFNHKKQT